MDTDERQERRDKRREKERTRMVVHKVKSPRHGERLVKLATRRAVKSAAGRGARPAGAS
jgi:hypothetical protein